MDFRFRQAPESEFSLPRGSHYDVGHVLRTLNHVYRSYMIDEPQYTNESVVRCIAATGQIDEPAARQRFNELQRFLAVAASTRDRLMPSREIDDAWHEFILHTREYATFCEEHLGRFVHHEPSVPADEATYERTRDLLRARFGKVDSHLWPRGTAGVIADCGEPDHGG